MFPAVKRVWSSWNVALDDIVRGLAWGDLPLQLQPIDPLARSWFRRKSGSQWNESGFSFFSSCHSLSSSNDKLRASGMIVLLNFFKFWACQTFSRRKFCIPHLFFSLAHLTQSVFILGHTKRKWEDIEGGSGRWPGYVMSTKVIFRRAEVCLPRCPHAVIDKR